MKNLTASDRSALIRLAASLPKGSEERRAILAGLSKSAAPTADDWELYAKPGVGDAVRILNAALAEGYRFLDKRLRGKRWDEYGRGLSPENEEIMHIVHMAMGPYERAADSISGFGASDTEPRAFAWRSITAYAAKKLGVSHSAIY